MGDGYDRAMADQPDSADPRDSAEPFRPHRVVVLAMDGALPFELGIPHRIFGRPKDTWRRHLYDVVTCSIRPPGPVRTDSDFDIMVPNGPEILATAETSAAGRGRHTTSHRELVPLPSGAVLLDTPGMRELQLWADEEVLDTTFSEIGELAAQCKFTDCAHSTEPGCAIRRALNEGRLSQERWASYCKLQRELRALAIGKDARLRSEQRKKWAKFSKSRRKIVY